MQLDRIIVERGLEMIGFKIGLRLLRQGSGRQGM
jgi:hypothetical protein